MLMDPLGVGYNGLVLYDENFEKLAYDVWGSGDSYWTEIYDIPNGQRIIGFKCR